MCVEGEKYTFVSAVHSLWFAGLLVCGRISYILGVTQIPSVAANSLTQDSALQGLRLQAYSIEFAEDPNHGFIHTRQEFY